MPAFKTSEVLIYFAAMKNHLGFYPTASGVKAFAAELKDYPNQRESYSLLMKEIYL
jgi:uncharacterized protein YdhG (YjbR/CyaY superfamily)